MCVSSKACTPNCGLQVEMAPQEVQAVETWIAANMHEAEEAMSNAISEQPLSVVTQAFWEVLLVKGHRYV
jgi:hypothetical protein